MLVPELTPRELTALDASLARAPYLAGDAPTAADFVVFPHLQSILRASSKDAARAFDLRFGRSAAREALLAGEDPDAVMDRELPGVVAFTMRARRFHLYR